MDLIAILQVIAPVLGGFLGVGGIGAYFAYRSAKPKTEAEAQKVNAEVVVTFADGWEKLAKEMDSRLAKAEDKINALTEAMVEQDRKYREIISQKDREIKDLQDHNQALEDRVNSLEEELARYKVADGKQDETRASLHDDVDTAMDHLRKK